MNSQSSPNTFEIDSNKNNGSVARTMHGRPPTDSSAEVLIGRLPNTKDIIMDDVFGKLTSQYTWKPMRLVLTASELMLCRPAEEILRDYIPLHEIADVKKRSDMPGKDAGSENPHDSTVLARSNLSTFFEDGASDQLHIIQIRTVEDGHNRSAPLTCLRDAAAPDGPDTARRAAGGPTT